MSKLTYAERQKLPQSKFAIPSKAPESGSYPIDTANRARNALARVSQHGTPEEKAKVKAAVKSKFPGIEIGSQSEVQGAKMKRYGGRHTKG